MILDLLQKPKVLFNPSNKKHIAVYKNFLATGSWGNSCPFILQFPYLKVPDMIKDKLVHKFLKVEKVFK